MCCKQKKRKTVQVVGDDTIAPAGAGVWPLVIPEWRFSADDRAEVDGEGGGESRTAGGLPAPQVLHRRKPLPGLRLMHGVVGYLAKAPLGTIQLAQADIAAAQVEQGRFPQDAGVERR